jgi:hypothetical protein
MSPKEAFDPSFDQQLVVFVHAPYERMAKARKREFDDD